MLFWTKKNKYVNVLGVNAISQEKKVQPCEFRFMYIFLLRNIYLYPSHISLSSLSKNGRFITEITDVWNFFSHSPYISLDKAELGWFFKNTFSKGKKTIKKLYVSLNITPGIFQNKYEHKFKFSS